MKIRTGLFLMLFYCINAPISFAQEVREDTRPQAQKEDSNDMLKAENISKLDLLQALDLAGIQIHKFNLGEFDKKYDFFLLADEYVQGKLVKSDTLLAYNNEYHYFPGDDGQYFFDYIDQIKIFTKTEKNSSTLKISTYALNTQKEIGLNKLDGRQFYVWRDYLDTSWKLDQKVPLMIFASSWLDKKHNFHRFCGVVNLAEEDEDTQELLNSSPNYIIINYKVSEPLE